MKRQINVLDKTMSLHEIKDQIQLEFVEQQADFITNNLKDLINNTSCDAPVRKSNSYPLRRKHRNLSPSVKPQEKHWEEAIFRNWEKGDDCLDPQIPFRKIVSYQVMLRDTNKDKNWGELDLLGATVENIPVAIELKINPGEYLLRAIVEVLAYGIAMRKAFSGIDGCTLRLDWEKVVGKYDSLVNLPLVIVAPASYWQDVLSDSPKKLPFQTPIPSRQNIKNLMEKMQSVNYPLTFVEVKAKGEDESGLPVIIKAIVRDMPNQNCQ